MTRLARIGAARWAEVVGALTLLTRLPVGNLASQPPPGRCVWAHPVAGAVVGAIGAAVLVAGLDTGVPQPLAALAALAAMGLATGGLHEDGLADTADGLGGGRTAERKLAIMRDSRIGSFGGLVLAFSLLYRGTALAISPHPLHAVVLAAVLGRTAMLVPLLLLRSARADGLAASLGAAWRPVAAGFAVAAPAAVWSPKAAIGAFVAACVMSALARRQIGGYTGDVLGAVEQLAECAVLTATA